MDEEIGVRSDLIEHFVMTRASNSAAALQGNYQRTLSKSSLEREERENHSERDKLRYK
ncbi:hypothetical protein [Ktedonospora formicarum]|uniref:Uncharacterized protein n=1 Tax=Ktedonospora formicarum TaxID=2778364 RepID=A0A8J3I958_9CHLR|nr:hypothetical protein [Ktedonospora formicarum]GHO48063.1 hypothetical protein KSX_62260 [Ktedonospora formicarum]